MMSRFFFSFLSRDTFTHSSLLGGFPSLLSHFLWLRSKIFASHFLFSYFLHYNLVGLYSLIYLFGWGRGLL